MEDYEKIKQLAKEGKCLLTQHSRAKFEKFGFDEKIIADYISRSFILPAEEVDLSSESQKYFCICKSIFEWITIVILFYPDVIIVKTAWPSKKREISLYKAKQRSKG